MKTKEQRRAEYITKRDAQRKQYAFDNEWFFYRMHIACDEDYFVWESWYEYIKYQDKYTDRKFHIDFVNGMRFTATTHEECDALIKVFA